MKKKLIATLVAGAVLSTGLIGLTACGGGLSINKGEEVSEENWGKAYTATLEAKNFTVDSYTEITMKAKGASDFVKEELGVESVDMSVVTTGEGKAYYDLESSASYSKGTSKVKVSGVPEAMQESYSNKEYVVEVYSVKDGENIYMANYNGVQDEPKWEVNGYSASNVVGSTNPLAYMINRSFATEKGGATASVSTLYSAFTYSGGIYSATLYDDDVEYKVSVSIKGGYVVGLSFEYSEEETDEGFTESESYKIVYNFSNYGGTTVTPSDDAKKAVEDYKAE